LLCKVRKTMLKIFLNGKLLSSLLCGKHFSSKKFVKFNFLRKQGKEGRPKIFLRGNFCSTVCLSLLHYVLC
jgi:hypothetical protein